jgi:hypothetical protein
MLMANAVPVLAASDPRAERFVGAPGGSRNDESREAAAAVPAWSFGGLHLRACWGDSQRQLVAWRCAPRGQFAPEKIASSESRAVFHSVGRAENPAEEGGLPRRE